MSRLTIEGASCAPIDDEESDIVTNQPKPGWYPDPSGTGERWWNGVEWTADERVGPPLEPAADSLYGPPPTTAATPAHAPSSRSGWTKNKLVGLSGAAIVGVSTLLPWATGGGESANAYEKFLPWVVTGVSDDNLFDLLIAQGFAFLAIAVIAALIVMTGSQIRRVLVALLGSAATALAVANFVTFTDYFDDPDFGATVSIGIGLYGAAIGGLLIAVAPFLPRSASAVPQMVAATPPAPSPTPTPTHETPLPDPTTPTSDTSANRAEETPTAAPKRPSSEGGGAEWWNS